jgi:protein tyrosine/serine phosphatase
MRPEHFAEVLRDHGIRTVVCLNPGDGTYEPGIARGLGVDFVELPMPGDGKGDPALFHRYLEIVADQSRRPVLVHCAAGAYRTGVAIALYRMLFEGWPSDDAMREMAYYGCRIHGDEPLITHLRTTYESIPEDFVKRLTFAERPENFNRK